MIVYLSVSFLILNVVFSVIATVKMMKARAYSNYEPRFDFFFLMIWSYVPTSFMCATTDIFGSSLLDKYEYCLLFATIKNLVIISFLAAPLLSIYLFLLIFTKMKVETINYIGNIMCGGLIAFVSGLGMIVVDDIGAKRSRPIAMGVFKECIVSNDSFENKSLILVYACQVIVAVFIFMIAFYDRKQKVKVEEGGRGKKEKEKGKEKSKGFIYINKLPKSHTIRSFSFIFIATLLMSIIEKFIKYTKLFPKWTHHVCLDFIRSKPFVYSLIIILCDKSPSLDIGDYSMRVMLEIPNLRLILEKYVREKGSKRIKDLFKKIKKGYIELQNLKQDEVYKSDDNLNAKEGKIMNIEDSAFDKVGESSDINLKYLEGMEKEIFSEGLYEFYFCDDFITFLLKFKLTGMIEMELDDRRR